MTVPTGAPTTVGDYTLLHAIGEGGMGVVHLARRAGSDQRVALKVLRPHIVGDAEARSRLEREVASLRRVRSPWVAEVIDADPWGPVPYVATRYVPGLSLHDHILEEGPISGEGLRWFAAALAQALASVHAVGVLHRDVKPSNVLMEGRAPILIDFGLARVADDPRLTHTGWLLGTPGYLAPEILFGDDATAASDVHSWAATVTYAATGRPPFGRGPSMAILDRVRRGEHDLSGIGEPMRSLLDEALAVEPHQRPTLPELRDRLRVMDEGDLTAPYAVAGSASAPTVAQRVEPSAPATRVLRDSSELTDELLSEPDRPRTWPQKVRRAAVLTGLAAALAGAVAAFPILTAIVWSVAVWLIRSGSLAASAVGFRRDRRGRRWYDGVQALLLTPWDLIRSIPGTLLLLLWGFGLGASAGLLAFAIATDEPLALAVAGAGAAVATWLGPGGSRVRSPMARLIDPVAARPGRTGAALAVLIAAALGFGMLVEWQGPDWSPSQERPLSGPVLAQATAGHGTMGA